MPDEVKEVPNAKLKAHYSIWFLLESDLCWHKVSPEMDEFYNYTTFFDLDSTRKLATVIFNRPNVSAVEVRREATVLRLER